MRRPALVCFTAAALFPLTVPCSADAYALQRDAIYVNHSLSSQPYGFVYNKTTYMPIWYIQRVLNQLGVNNQWDGKTWTVTSPPYMPVDLSNVPTGGSGAKSIVVNGTSIYRVNGIASTPPGAKQPTMYMPIWYIQQVLNRFGIGSNWNGRTWVLTTPPPMSVTVADPADYPTLRYGNNGYPVALLQQKLNAAGFNVGTIDSQFGTSTQVAVEAFQRTANVQADGVVGQDTWLALNQRLAGVSPTPPARPAESGPKQIYTWVTGTASLQDARLHSVVTGLGDDSYCLSADGSVSGSSNPGSGSAQAFLTLANLNAAGNFDGNLMSTVLNTTDIRAKAEQNIVNKVVAGGYAGVDLDLEMVKPADRDAFTTFLAELGGQLHAAGKKLSVTVPAETSATAEPWNGGYDYAAIGNLADQVPLMTYDFSFGNPSAGPNSPLWWDESVVKFATSAMPASKVLLGIPAYGYDWVDSHFTALSLSAADRLVQSSQNISEHWDATDAEPYFTYTDANQVSHTVYYQNQASIQQRLDLAAKYGIAGIAFWRAGLENDSFWNAVIPWATN